MAQSLEQFLNSGSEGFPERDVQGVASEWMHVTSLQVSHGTLWAGDPYICDGADGCLVDVLKGDYVVEAQGYDFNGIRIIGRARARLSSASSISLGEMVGESGTDSALIAICDMRALDEAVAGDDDGFQNQIESHYFQKFGVARVNMQKEISIAYVNSGFGDGVGPVYRLMCQDECVGIELDFICEESND